ncbi:hypothetical protein XELAEV_18008025mg [Xenopus laevis]|uniref:Uncharacterized protein n=1 Tax=Xenopus laevis TaxID=8355 RepID=A0A974E2G3_XENLA|nr:hypothetical protein XELAEV_18008025mg [Xenopus laevis]
MDRGKKGSPDPGGTQDLARTFLKVPATSCDHQPADRMSDGKVTGERNLGLAVSCQSVGATDGSNLVASSFVCRERSEESSEIRPSVSTEFESTSIALENDVFLHPGATKIEAQALRPTASQTNSSVLEPPKFKNVSQMSLRPVDKTPRTGHNVFGLIPFREKQLEAFIFPDTGVAKSKMGVNVILHKDSSPTNCSVSDHFSPNFLQEPKSTGQKEAPTSVS